MAAAPAARTLAGWLSRRLSRRIVALFLGLLLVVQGLSFLATRESVSRNAREQIAQELQLGERVFRRLLTQNAQKLSDGATLLAADYGFRSAVATNDTDTIGSVLLNHGERIGASIALLLDTRFALRAAGQRDAADLMPAVHRLAERTAFGMSQRPASEIVALGGHAYQLVMVPLRAPLVIGWVVMGFDIGPSLVNDMREVTALQATLLVRPDDAGTPRIGATTLEADQAAWLAAMDWGGDGLTAVQRAALRVDGEEFGARMFVLNPDDGGSVRTVLMRSVDEAVAPYRQLQLVMALLTVLGVAVFAAGSVFTARRITTPVRALVRAAERLGEGDYQSPVQVRSADEIGELAQAFERMRVNVDTQQREITRLAYWDSLTGLPNRAQFRVSAAAALAEARTPPILHPDDRREGSPGHVSVLMLDMDRFKHVNDVMGYEVGDRMLQQVGQRLGQVCVRQGDLVARLSGDEFAVLLPATDTRDALRVAERVAAAFEAPLVLDDQTIDLRASIGVATSPAHAQDADTLLNRAEVAMYAAKRRGAGALAYDPAFDSGSARTISLLSGLRHAVDHHELRLVLQPKVALHTGHVEGAEALVRWQHPQRGPVPPMEFIPFAEQTGFIRTLTAWILDECLHTWRALASQGLAMPLSVNLSTRDLMDLELPQKFEALLQRHGAPSEALCLEITESAIMDDPARAQQTLERLHEMGLRLAIDDFGTGYSSLAYLKRLPVQELKIDKSFVMQMERDSDDAKIVRSTVDLAHNLGLSVVAEGVETPSHWRTLRGLDCDLAQGYLIARPLPSDAFAAWVRRWTEHDARVLQEAPTTLL
ncbi:putative bifunctional diguanylate cyclase/phosphodiesterase [Caldimonas caldifontis]|uniref:GGDEF domain-containing protein n=1 Tax=Caldimonas caldifontis TaxID=1452508 RepID=A0A2S5SX72_9BURK|nr:EAL domain-containing protein [Caldimonas caldifontis]PPE67229.1 GGDEF domain-containing protein [Caldimonas caldifontis]